MQFDGGATSALLRVLRRPRALVAAPVLAALASGGVALFGGTIATAAPAVSTSAPFVFEMENPCVVPAEAFLATGTVHLLLSANDSAGGTAQSHLEANLQGVSGVTLLTGKKYVVVDSQSLSISLDTDDVAPFRTTFTWTVQFVRAGEDGSILTAPAPFPPGGDDFYERIVAHATVNANGVPVVDRITHETRCR